MKRLLSIFVVLLGLMLATESYAEAPKLITFQAQLVDSRTNAPLDGNIPISFEIYESETGGSALWVEHNNVSVENGFINVYLGGKTPFPSYMKFDKQYYVQITVNGKAYPRTPLTSVPYSMYATTADTSDFSYLAATVVDGAITQSKLAPGVQAIPWGAAGGVLSGTYPNPQLNVSSVRTALKGQITQDMFADDIQLIPGGPAGGDLMGTYPNPQLGERVVKAWNIAEYAVTTPKIDNYAVTNIKIAPNAVTSDKIATDAVGDDEIAPTGVIDGTYGSKLYIPTFTVNEDGRLTYASETRFIPFADSYDGNDIAFNIAHTGANNALALMASKTNGRAAEITSESSYPAGWTMGLDPTDAVDATLIVRNTSTDPDKPAIKTYGDIIVNSSIYASNLYATDQVVVGSGSNIVTITPPVNEGDPLEFSDDVLINGNLFVTDTIFGTINGQMVGKLSNGAGIAAFNYDGNADATVGIADGGVTNAMLENSSLTVTAGAGLTGGGVVPLGGSVEVALPTVGTSGTYGSNTKVPVITVDNFGRVTNVNATDIAFPAETDPIFAASPASGITAAQVTNWDNVYTNAVYTTGSYANPAWLTSLDWSKITNTPAAYPPSAHTHDWSDVTGTPTTLAGYGITDAMSTAHPANAITGTQIANWDAAYNWGDHAAAGYMTEADFNATPASGITAAQVTNWDAAYNWGDHAAAGYMTEAAFNATPASGITAAQVTNWDAAYNWGDHALAGYLAADDFNATPAASITSAQVTSWNNVAANAVYTTGSYADPAWLTSLDWSKIAGKPAVYPSAPHTHDWADVTGTPTTLAGYGITDAISLADIAAAGYLTEVETNATLTGDGTVADPIGLNLANSNTWTVAQGISGNYDDATPLLVVNNTNAAYSGTLIHAQISVANSGTAAIFSSNNVDPLDATVIIEQNGIGDALYTDGNVTVDGNLNVNQTTNLNGSLYVSSSDDAPMVDINNTNPTFSNTLIKAQVSTANSGTAAIFSSNNPDPLDATVFIEQNGAGGSALYAVGNVTVDGDVVANNLMTTSHPANAITGAQITNWDAAYSWGDHAAAGYMTEAAFNATPASGITAAQVTSWDNVYTNAVYTTGSYADPAWLTSLDWSKITNTPAAYPPSAHTHVWTDITGTPTTVEGYGITNAMKTSHPANVITVGDIANWNEAYSWGDHAAEGYLTDVATDATLTGDGTVANPIGLDLANSNTWSARQNINANDVNYALFVANSNANGTAGYFNANSTNEAVIIEQDGTGDALYVSGNTTLDGDVEINGSVTGANNLMTTAHAANAITAADITNWNDVYTNAVYANSVYNNPAWLNTLAWGKITGTPTTLAGYGITDAMSTSHPANAIAATDIINWNEAYSWGDHAAEGYLKAVAHDATLTGDGTAADPIGLNLANSNTWTAAQGISGSNAGSVPMLAINNTNAAYSGTLIRAQISAANSGTAAIFSSNNVDPLDATVFIEQNGAGDALYVSGNVTVDGDVVANNLMTTSHPANAITGAQITNWDAAYSWGDHAAAGYMTEAAFNATPASGITAAQVTSWNNVAANAVYTTGSYANPAWLTSLDWSKITNTPAAYPPSAHTHVWTDITGTPTTLAGYGITDAMSTSHPANAIAATDIINWNEAYSWGDHAAEGYLKDVATDATLTGDGTVANPIGLDLAHTNTWTVPQNINANDAVSHALFVENANANGTAAYFHNNSNNETVIIDQDGAGDALYVSGNTTLDGDVEINGSVTGYGENNWLARQNINANLNDYALFVANTHADGSAGYFEVNSTSDAVTIVQNGAGDALYVSGNTTLDGDVEINGTVTGVNNLLTTVAHDATLTGDGTVATPLGLDLAHSNTWTAAQSFDNDVTFGDGTLGNTVQVQNDGSAPALTVMGGDRLNNIPALDVEGDTYFTNSQIELTDSRIIAESGALAEPFVTLTNTNAAFNDYILNVLNQGAGSAGYFGNAPGNADAALVAEGDLAFVAQGKVEVTGNTDITGDLNVAGEITGALDWSNLTKATNVADAGKAIVVNAGGTGFELGSVANTLQDVYDNSAPTKEISTTGVAPIIFSSADNTSVLQINTTSATALALEATGSVFIKDDVTGTDNNDALLTVNYTSNNTTTQDAISATNYGYGAAAYLIQANSNANHTSAPALYVESNSDGSNDAGAGYRFDAKGAAIYAHNNTIANTSTALYIERGRTVLAYASVANNVTLAASGYATVIYYTAAANTNFGFADLPANAENGQILYITCQNAQTFDTAGINRNILADQTLTFVYAGGAWRLLN